MKQVLEDARSGSILVPEVPAPFCRPRTVLVRTCASLISAGTEGAMLNFGKQSLLEKARSRPDLVKQVIAKARTDGLRATYQAVQARLDLPLALGYSSAGEVLEVGAGMEGVEVGDRVACAGAGYASHAELVIVPKNLVVPIPEGVSDEDAAFATAGAIALQGIRIADVRVGERVVVIGLGLIGLLVVQLLKASGCQVLGVDLNPGRVRLAQELGADASAILDAASLPALVDSFTRGRGADAVLIAAATSSNEPVELAGAICRQKGRVVVIGDVRMDVPRRTYYEKELELRLSMSYGPGRYDPLYEEKGVDYPHAYVPFTEQRNMETFLQLVAEQKVTPARLVTHRFPIADAEKAYALLKGERREPYLGVLFTYPAQAPLRRRVDFTPQESPPPTGEAEVRMGVIGAGTYARSALLPRLKNLPGVQLVGVSTSRGLTSWDAGRRFNFDYATTEASEVLRDDRVNLVLIATRHDSHASLTRQALLAGKHVFVEKPLATSEEDLRSVIEAVAKSGRHVVVGFNRRFSPLVQHGKERFRSVGQPLAMIYRVNAGAIPRSHWTQDGDEGGGRIVGEVCHFVDLLQYFCGSPPVSVSATAVSGDTGSIPAEDIVTISIRFGDGSIGSIHYFASGDKAVPKEYLEVYGGGKTFILDDFRRAQVAEGGKITRWKAKGQDKGQDGELQALVNAVRNGGPAAIPLSEAVLTTLTTFRILDSLRSGVEAPVDWTGGEANGAAPGPNGNGAANGSHGDGEGTGDDIDPGGSAGSGGMEHGTPPDQPDATDAVPEEPAPGSGVRDEEASG